MVKRMFKSSVMVLMLALVCLTLNVLAAEVVLNPIGDTFVRDGDNATANFGDSNRLELKWESDRAGMTRVALLKFDLSNVAAVEKATLRLYAEFSDQLDAKVLGVYDVTGEQWAESEVTWENAPLKGGTFVADINTTNQANIWLEMDLTKQVKEQITKGSKEIAIRIEHKSDHWGGAVFVTSKEGAKNRPELVIVN